MEKRGLCTLLAIIIIVAASSAAAQDMSNEEFTDHDFDQFFGLIENGKITLEKMLIRCEKEVVGVTFAGLDLTHSGERDRIEYNQTQVRGSVDSRVMRSRHFNVSVGEWTGAVFKPVCSGLWSMTVDFDATPNTRVELYVRKPGEDRPGTLILSSKTGQLSLAMPLGTGDEVSTYTVALGDEAERRIEQATFTVYKIGHIEKYMTELDMDAWAADLLALK